MKVYTIKAEGKFTFQLSTTTEDISDTVEKGEEFLTRLGEMFGEEGILLSFETIHWEVSS